MVSLNDMDSSTLISENNSYPIFVDTPPNHDNIRRTPESFLTKIGIIMNVKFVILLSLAVTASAASTAHVVLVIGQSNSVGTNGEGHTNEDAGNPAILQTSCCINGGTNNDACKLIAGQDPLHHQCDTGYLNGPSIGFGMTFARQLLAEIPNGDIIVLVPAAIGGTGFVDNVWPAYTGTGFLQAVKRLLATFNLLKQQYPQLTASFDGMLWHQGETDAGSTTDAHVNNNLIPMINAFRDQNLIPQTSAKVPFVVGNLVPGWIAAGNQINMETALGLISQRIPYTATAPSSGLKGATDTDVHFTAPSQRNFGKRYFAAWKLAQSSIPSAN